MIGFGVLIGVWQVLSTYFVDPRILPSFLSSLIGSWNYTRNGDLPFNMAISLGRILMGFILGTSSGVILGLFMGRITALKQFVDPIISLFRNLSPTAMIPLAIIWFGIGETSKYFIIFWGTFFFVLIPTMGAVQSVPDVRVRAARSLGAKTLQIFFQVVVPSATPTMIVTIRAALGGAFMSVVAAELVAATSGIGYFIDQGRILFQTDRVIIGLAVLATSGYCVDRAYRELTRKLLPNYKEEVAAKW